METPGEPPPGQPRELPVVGGDLALDFANSVDDPEGPARHDHVADYPALLAWSVRVAGLAAPHAEALRRRAARSPSEAAAVLDRAHDLRDLLNAGFGALVHEGPDAGFPEWAGLRDFAVEAEAHAELVADTEGFRRAWPAGDLAAPLWPVAQAAVDLLTGPQLRRLKQCAGCPWLFLDQSRNLSRRWCAMGDCGTHAKIRRYVERRAGRRTAG